MYMIKFLYSVIVLPPGCLLIGLLLLCIYYKHRNHTWPKTLIGITILFYIFAMPWVADELLNSLERRYQPPNAPQGDVIVMLGGGATLDTPNLGGLGHLSGFAANRLLTSVQLYHRLQIPILVSGGKVFANTGTEAEIAKTILLGLGVPEDDIIVESSSLNTTENARNTKELMELHGLSRPILVTSAFHMPRAVRQFEKHGLRVQPYPTDYQTNVARHLNLYQLCPSSSAMQGVQLALKEYIGILAAAWY